MFRAITFVALVAYASAQSISTNCTNTLTSILQNRDAATCLSMGSLLTAVNAGSSTASIVSSLDSWLTSLCAAPACTNATLSSVVQNITTGCVSDLSHLGIDLSSTSTASIVNIVEQYYPTVRRVVCLKDGNTNCITQTLNNTANAIGSVNLTTITTMTGNSLADLPANISCTNCIKAIYNNIAAEFPSLTTDAVPALQSKCGASFTDGQAPSGIVDSASTATSASSNSAAWSLLSHGVFTGLSLSGLVVISTFFTLLA